MIVGGSAATLGARRQRHPEQLGLLSPAALSAVLAALGTLLVLLVPTLHFAYRMPELRVALETTATLVAVLAAGLVFARFRRSRRLDDLLLALALGVLAETNLCFAAAPVAFLDGRAESFSSWATPSGQLVGAVVLAAASVAPGRALILKRQAELAALFVMAGVLAAITVALVVIDPAVPVSLTRPGIDASHPHLPSEPGILFLHGAALAAFAWAAVGYARRAANARDSLISAIAVGAVLAAFARVNYILFPTFSTQWIYTGDAYRLAFYLVVLAGATLEIRSYWTATAQTAVLEERRRIARDLHDTVAQELSFIARNAQRIGRDPDVTKRVVAAAERALADTRLGIAALTRPLDQPVALALEEALDEIAHRVECRLELSLADGVVVEQHVRHALVRIACEAVSNAARHAGAERITVELMAARGLRMRVRDEGCGFEPGSVSAGRLGITSMCGWAEAIGADFELRTQPGVGTEVEVVLP